DEVICQSFTFSASANPILYQGASPVFVGSEPGSWNMDPEALDACISDRVAITGRLPKAIVVVHLYGMPAKMDGILAVAGKWGIPVLEDAAEALGSEYKGKKCGTSGKYGVLSFNGNKMITTSGGGALVCPDEEAVNRVKFYATQARENRPYYYHEVVGYNYRMSNICAGIGVGQMEVLEERVARRRAIHNLYTELFSDTNGVSVQANPCADFDSNFWLSTIVIDPATGRTPDEVRLALAAQNIETRLLWRPMHMQPVFADAPYYASDGTEERLFDTGLCLPSGSVLTDDDVRRVAASINDLMA
ncbi:MAG: DegT/DnrJ/EryC1/StrS family aminotransferase, partial [Muribaculaceae bacterium]|nr:DegT/DnrJ/EryC1/StrS family aminotransferase [Muribaculaceae bacterium]